MKLSDILLIAAAVVVALGVIGIFLQKRHPEKGKGVENVADLNDHFNRARTMGQDGR